MFSEKTADSNKNFDIVAVVDAAIKVPGVKVKRDDFLRKQFSAPKYNDIVKKIVSVGPIKAGVPEKEVEKIAKNCINYETTEVTAISALAGIPGGLAMIGTIPGDLAQFYAHVLIIIQKLMYLYGWEDVGRMDDGTKNILIMFLGIMSGANVAQNLLKNITKSAATKASKTLAAKALTKTTYYPIIKQICKALSIRMTKQIFAESVSKAIPVLGAFVSGALTFATFKPNAEKLLKNLIANS